MSRRGLIILGVGAALAVVMSLVACGLGIFLIPCETREGDLFIARPTEQVRAALTSAGIAASDVSTRSYGVSCEDRLGRIRSYTLRDTTVRLTVQVADANNLEVVGDELVRVLNALDTVPTDAKLNRVAVTARGGSGQRAVREFPVGAGVEARRQGLRGAALVEFLERPR